MSEQSSSGTERKCPTCDSVFNSLAGMKIHHSKAHDESIAGFEKECANCGDEFVAEARKAKYCSESCSRENQRRREEIVCESCGSVFEAAPSDERKYCSQDCYYDGESKKRISKTCANCGVDFDVRPSESERQFCSRECHFEHGRVTLECENCGDEFTVQKSNEDQQYCSRSCQNHGRSNRVEVECAHCGSGFEKLKSRAEPWDNHYCSMECRRGGTEIYPCDYCGDDVRVQPAEQHLDNHYCDIECYSAGSKKRETVSCEQCGAEIERWDYEVKKYESHFCSRECQAEFKRTGDYRDCANCGDSVYTVPSRDKSFENIFCSVECKNEYHTGEDHPSYNSLTVKCWNCEEELTRKRSRVNNTKRHFCDPHCWSEWVRWAGKDPNDPVPDKDYPRWKYTRKTPPESQADYFELSLPDKFVLETEAGSDQSE